jgi:hypothetical protein
MPVISAALANGGLKTGAGAFFCKNSNQHSASFTFKYAKIQLEIYCDVVKKSL